MSVDKSDRSFDKYLTPSVSSSTDKSVDQEDDDDLELTQTRKIKKKPPSSLITNLEPEVLREKLLEEIGEADRYALINEAKLRALRQGTNNYEEFRQIWKAAHLRSLDKKEVDGFVGGGGGKNSRVVWNTLVVTGGDSPGSLNSTSNILNDKEQGDPDPYCKLKTGEGDIKALKVPKSSMELWRTWKKLETVELKLQYLCDLLEEPSHPLESLWEEEVPCEMFSDLIHLASNICKDSDSNQTQMLLKTFQKAIEIASNSKRISITLSFLEAKDKDLLEQLIQLILQDTNSLPLTRLKESLH